MMNDLPRAVLPFIASAPSARLAEFDSPVFRLLALSDGSLQPAARNKVMRDSRVRVALHHLGVDAAQFDVSVNRIKGDRYEN